MGHQRHSLRRRGFPRASPAGRQAREQHLMNTKTTTMHTRTRQVDGLTIRYADTDAANGPDILLTSPWPESLLAFRRVWPALATGARLIAIDLPGFGHSEGRTDLFTPGAMAEFLVQLIGEFRLGSPHLLSPGAGGSGRRAPRSTPRPPPPPAPTPPAAPPPMPAPPPSGARTAACRPWPPAPSPENGSRPSPPPPSPTGLPAPIHPPSTNDPP